MFTLTSGYDFVEDIQSAKKSQITNRFHFNIFSDEKYIFVFIIASVGLSVIRSPPLMGLNIQTAHFSGIFSSAARFQVLINF